MNSEIVYLIDDDEAVLESLQLVAAGYEFSTQSFRTADDFWQEFDSSMAGCVVTDVRMPGMSGLHLQQMLRSRNTTIPVIFITAYGDVSAAVRAMKDGATDFFTKPVDPETLFECVQGCLDAARKNADTRKCQENRNDRFESLSGREKEVYLQVVEGCSGKQIAHQLDISYRTMEKHRANVMKKLQVGSVAELVLYAVQQGHLDVGQSGTTSLRTESEVG